MQATIDASALKPFTRALTCLSRYGDELTICGYPDSLTIYATNSAKSAFCRFKYDKGFFSRYNIGNPRPLNRANGSDDLQEVEVIKGQLLAKNLLSILKHRTVEKSVERCELSIIEGSTGDEGSDDEVDSLESKLIVKLLCKHGVVKTHRLVLSVPVTLSAPSVPDTPDQARVTVGPTPLRNMLEHFPIQKGSKADPQLIWSFDEADIALKTCETLISKGNGEISTELTISADEFDVYDIHAYPIVIAFHLREFNATIAYAESMALSLDMRFTETTAPLFINVEGDCAQGLFVIATNQPPGVLVPTGSNKHRQVTNKKRDREETPAENRRPKRSMKVVRDIEVDTALVSAPQSRQSSRAPSSMPPPSFPNPMPPPSYPNPMQPPSLPNAFQGSPAATHQPSQRRNIVNAPGRGPLFLPHTQLSGVARGALQESSTFIHQSSQRRDGMKLPEREPLFLPPSQFSVAAPGTFREPPASIHLSSQRRDLVKRAEREPLFLPSSQLSVAENNFLKEAGLGDIETLEELNELLEEDGNEIDFSSSKEHALPDLADGRPTDKMRVDEASGSLELVDNEPDFGPTQTMQKGFQPLFND